jgi:hypothetical protein
MKDKEDEFVRPQIMDALLGLKASVNWHDTPLLLMDSSFKLCGCGLEFDDSVAAAV